MPCFFLVTLPETNIAMENPPFWWYLPGKMGIVMGYVSFREGKWKDHGYHWISCFFSPPETAHRVDKAWPSKWHVDTWQKCWVFYGFWELMSSYVNVQISSYLTCFFGVFLNSCLFCDTNESILLRQTTSWLKRDLFGMVKWPLQRLSDLQIGDKKRSPLESPWTCCKCNTITLRKWLPISPPVRHQPIELAGKSAAGTRFAVFRHGQWKITWNYIRKLTKNRGSKRLKKF